VHDGLVEGINAVWVRAEGNRESRLPGDNLKKSTLGSELTTGN